MKHRTQAPEFSFTAGAFNLAGQVITQPDPAPEMREDRTQEMFIDHAAVQDGRRVIAREMEEGNL